MTYTEAARAYRAKIERAAMYMPDETAFAEPTLFPPWREDGTYVTGDRVRYGDLLYKCVQGHAAQAGWTPEKTPALWARIAGPAEEWPEWIPYAGTVIYDVGSKVTHKGKRWVSDTPNNVWVPGEFGWTEQT